MLDLAAEQLQNPLVPQLNELLVGGVTFGIIFFALWKVLIPRLNQTLEERTDKIEGGLQRAEETQAEADATLARYREQLAEARHEAARLREEAREQGAQIIAEMREQAQADGRAGRRGRPRGTRRGAVRGDPPARPGARRAPGADRSHQPHGGQEWPGPAAAGRPRLWAHPGPGHQHGGQPLVVAAGPGRRGRAARRAGHLGRGRA